MPDQFHFSFITIIIIIIIIIIITITDSNRSVVSHQISNKTGNDVGVVCGVLRKLYQGIL
jgi:uncharacterized membrane protein